MEQADCLGGDQRGLFGGLGHHGIAGGQRGRDLAREDGQREIPRTDTGEHAATVQHQAVGLARWTGQGLGAGKVALGQHGVVAAEVGGFAHLGHAVVQRLAGLAAEQGDQTVEVGFQPVGHGAQDVGARGAALTVPGQLGAARLFDGGVDLLGRGLGHMAQHVVTPIGVGDILGMNAGVQQAADHRTGRQPFAVHQLQRLGMGLAIALAGIVATQRIQAVAVHRPGHGDAGVAVGLGLDQRDGVGGDRYRGHPLVHQHMGERGVGAVLQQAADQIGQQFLVPADGGIGAHHRPVVLPARLGGVIERLAHAVQALELDLHIGPTRHAVDGGQGDGIVGGELAIQMRGCINDGLGADQIVHIGRGLGRVDGIVGPPHDLGALDLGVPIGALDQTHHQPPA